MNDIQPPRVDFSNMIGPKRRRMRSGGNVSTITNNTPKEIPSMSGSVDDEKTVQTSKCKGSTTIPIFLKSALVKWSITDTRRRSCFLNIASLMLNISPPSRATIRNSFYSLLYPNVCTETYKMIESSPTDIAAWYVNIFPNSIPHQWLRSWSSKKKHCDAVIYIVSMFSILQQTYIALGQ